MNGIQAQFVGVELYFDDLEGAKEFYAGTLGLEISDSKSGITPSLTVALVLFVLSGRGLSPIHRRTKLCSSLRFPT